MVTLYLLLHTKQKRDLHTYTAFGPDYLVLSTIGSENERDRGGLVEGNQDEVG